MTELNLRKIQDALGAHQRQLAVHKSMLMLQDPMPPATPPQLDVPVGVAAAESATPLVQDAAGQRSGLLRELRNLVASPHAPGACSGRAPCRDAFRFSDWHQLARLVELLRRRHRIDLASPTTTVLDELLLDSGWPFAALDCCALRVPHVAHLAGALRFAGSMPTHALRCDLLPTAASVEEIALRLRSPAQFAEAPLVCTLPASLVLRHEIAVWRDASDGGSDVDTTVAANAFRVQRSRDGAVATLLCCVVDYEPADDSVLLALPSDDDSVLSVAVPVRDAAAAIWVNAPALAAIAVEPVLAAASKQQQRLQQATKLVAAAGLDSPLAAEHGCRLASHLVAVALARALGSKRRCDELIDRCLLQRVPLDLIVEAPARCVTLAQMQHGGLLSSGGLSVLRVVERPSLDELRVALRDLLERQLADTAVQCLVLYDRSKIFAHDDLSRSRLSAAGGEQGVPLDTASVPRSGWALLTGVAEHPHLAVTAVDGSPALLPRGSWTADVEAFHGALSTSTVEGSAPFPALHGLVIVRFADADSTAALAADAVAPALLPFPMPITTVAAAFNSLVSNAAVPVVTAEDLLRSPAMQLAPRAQLLLGASPSAAELHLLAEDFVRARSGQLAHNVTVRCELLLPPLARTEPRLRDLAARGAAILVAFDRRALGTDVGVAHLRFRTPSPTDQVAAVAELHGVRTAASLSTSLAVHDLRVLLAAASGFVVISRCNFGDEGQGASPSAPSRYRPLSAAAAPLFPPLRHGPAPHLAALAIALSNLGGATSVAPTPEAIFAAACGTCAVPVSRMASDLRVQPHLYRLARDVIAPRAAAVKLVRMTDDSADGAVLDALSDGAVLLALYDRAVLHGSAAGGGRADPPATCRDVGAALIEGFAPASRQLHLLVVGAECTSRAVVDLDLFVRAGRAAADGGDRKDLAFDVLSLKRC